MSQPATPADSTTRRAGNSIKRIIGSTGPLMVLLMIVASLGSAIFFMMRDRGNSKRMVKALAIRVGLSLALFLFLMGGYYFGLFPARL